MDRRPYGLRRRDTSAARSGLQAPPGNFGGWPPGAGARRSGASPQGRGREVVVDGDQVGHGARQVERAPSSVEGDQSLLEERLLRARGVAVLEAGALPVPDVERPELDWVQDEDVGDPREGMDERVDREHVRDAPDRENGALCCRLLRDLDRPRRLNPPLTRPSPSSTRAVPHPQQPPPPTAHPLAALPSPDAAPPPRRAA